MKTELTRLGTHVIAHGSGHLLGCNDGNSLGIDVQFRDGVRAGSPRVYPGGAFRSALVVGIGGREPENTRVAVEYDTEPLTAWERVKGALK